MKTLQTAANFFLLISLISCASAIERAHNVTIKNKEPGKECKQVGAVVASPLSENENSDAIQTRLVERAMAKGGNYIHLETVDGKGGLTGMAFSCP